MTNALAILILFVAMIIGVICPGLDSNVNDSVDIEENQVCPDMAKVAEYRNLSMDELQQDITEWSIQEKCNDLPRQLVESYYMMQVIADMESNLFKRTELTRPFQTSPSFAAFNRMGERRRFSKEYLMDAAGILNERGNAVVEAAYRDHNLVRPVIAAKLREDATIVFRKLADYLRATSSDENLIVPPLVEQFERRVYGNLKPQLRIVRLMNADAFKKSQPQYSGLNPVTLLIAYLQWPGFPIERPSLTNFQDHELQQILGVEILQPGTSDYELPQTPTQFENVLGERLTIEQRAALMHKASRFISLPLVIGSVFTCFKSFLHGEVSVPSLAVLYVTGKAMNGFLSVSNRYERSLTSTERQLMSDHSPFGDQSR